MAIFTPLSPAWLRANFSWDENAPSLIAMVSQDDHLASGGALPVRREVMNTDTEFGLPPGTHGWIAVLDSALRHEFEAASADLIHELRSTGADRCAVILLPRKTPPDTARRGDGEVTSFLCSRSVFLDLMSLGGQTLGRSCYSLLRAVLDGHLSVSYLVIRELPQAMPVETYSSSDAAVVIPHRGPLTYLDQTLAHVHLMTGAGSTEVLVGLDEDDTSPYRPLSDRYRGTRLYTFAPTPAGPYVIRQDLVELASAEFLMFQDSDDIPTSDRLVRQSAELTWTGADMMGCHELAVDERTEQVYAYRFPLDVNWALDHASALSECCWGSEPMLHATAMVKRREFLSVGGFSTDLRIANDTQFMLRAHSSLRMMNAEAFLYVRRVHANALTVAPETALGTELRKQLAQQWSVDFQRIRRGELTLEDSSLAVRRSTREHRCVPLPDNSPVTETQTGTDRRVIIAPNVTWTRSLTSVVVMDARSHVPYALNQTASRIWNCIVKGATTAAIQEVLMERYPGAERQDLNYDLCTFLSLLEKRGLIESRSAVRTAVDGRTSR